jgi:hypothetical protein
VVPRENFLFLSFAFPLWLPTPPPSHRNPLEGFQEPKRYGNIATYLEGASTYTI